MKRELLTFNKLRASKNIPQSIKSEIKQFIADENTLPNLSPDLIDDFITWALPRFCLNSFRQSDLKFKISKINEFFQQLSIEKKQFKLDL